MQDEALAESARKDLNRADSAVRSAREKLAVLADGADVFSASTLTDAPRSRAAILAALDRAVSLYGVVEVIVRPLGRRGSTPTTAPTGAKEKNDARGSCN